MIKKLFLTIEKIWHRAEDHIEEWRRQDQARNAEAEADRDKLWAEAKERQKLLAKTIGGEDARRASVGESTERQRFVFVFQCLRLGCPARALSRSRGRGRSASSRRCQRF